MTNGAAVPARLDAGKWCTIGSTNFDPRSFRVNDEISVALYDRDIAGWLATLARLRSTAT